MQPKQCSSLKLLQMEVQVQDQVPDPGQNEATHQVPRS